MDEVVGSLRGDARVNLQMYPEFVSLISMLFWIPFFPPSIFLDKKVLIPKMEQARRLDQCIGFHLQLKLVI